MSIPMDTEEIEAFVTAVEKVVKEAAELAQKVHPNPVWWSEEHGYLITREGITLYEHELEHQYGYDSVAHRSITITWLDLLKPEVAIARWNASKEAAAKETAKRQKDWERDQYERLKAKFEKP